MCSEDLVNHEVGNSFLDGFLLVSKCISIESVSIEIDAGFFFSTFFFFLGCKSASELVLSNSS